MCFGLGSNIRVVHCCCVQLQGYKLMPYNSLLLPTFDASIKCGTENNRVYILDRHNLKGHFLIPDVLFINRGSCLVLERFLPSL